MRSLRDEQRALQRAIVTDDAQAPGIARERAPRLGIYRHAYRARLAAALRSNYPALAQLLGDGAFERLANDYARAHPSRHFSIRWHGHALAQFVGAGPLRDLARMEWALGEAFDAPDAPALDGERLGAVPVERWGELALALHPSVSVLEMEWAVENPWQRLRDGEAMDAAAIDARPHALLVWRKNLDAHWRSAGVDEAQALLALHTCATLERACEGRDEAQAQRLGTWFAGWVREGMLVRSGSLPS